MAKFAAHLFLGPAVILGALVNPGYAVPAATDTPSHSAQWEPAIRAFEAADKTNPPPLNAVLFIGSSSVRLWKSLAADFPEHKVINRGFGGSHLSDSVAFVDRTVIPYKPKLVVLYAGDNDIAAGKSAEEVMADFKSFERRIHTALPQTCVAFLSIKPCPAREKYLDLVKTTNGLIRDYATANSNLVYVDIFTSMLGTDGRPRADLCLKDGLHPNAQGYALWTSILKPVLAKYDPPM